MPDPRENLSAMNPTGRFAGRAADYVRFRPSYPAGAIDAVLDGLGDPAHLLAADIGAGTGISARLLGDRGVRVIAIEPNAPMRDAAQAHPLVIWHDATAERTSLRDSAVHLVLCAQAFHWFNPEAALAEFRRILAPGGRCAVLWNLGDPDDEFIRAYYDIVFNASDEARSLGDKRRYAQPFADAPGWRLLPEVHVRHEQEHDLEGLLGRARSASYVPASGPGLARVERQLTDLFNQHQHRGVVIMRYRTSVYRAES